MLAVLFFLAVTLAFQNGILACLVDVCILGWFWPDHPTCICLFAGCSCTTMTLPWTLTATAMTTTAWIRKSCDDNF